jgi:hypothetical protein
MQEETTVAIRVSGNAHLPAVALHLGCCGGGTVTERCACWQCGSKIDHATPW